MIFLWAFIFLLIPAINLDVLSTQAVLYQVNSIAKYAFFTRNNELHAYYKLQQSALTLETKMNHVFYLRVAID